MPVSSTGQARPLVLLVGYRDSRSSGGSLRVLETLARSLPAEGFDVEILFAYGEAGGVSKVCGCPVHLMRARGPYDLSAWRRVRRLIRERRPSILQFVDNVNWMILAVQGFPIPRLLYAHGRTIWDKNAPKNWLLSRLQHGLSDGVVAISYGVKRSLVSLGLVSSSKVWVVHNALDRRFEGPSDIARSVKSSIASDSIVLGMACRLTVHKGVFDAIAVMRLLPDHWKLMIAGEGPARGELEQRVIEYGLESRVSLLGNIEDMVAFYNSIDYYLFLSRYEPFGLVLAEAMFTGIPVVGLRADGEYAESEYPLIDDSVALLLMREDLFDYNKAPTFDELIAFVDQLQLLHEDAHRRQIMTAQARERVRTRFIALHQASKLAQVYRGLLDRSRPSSSGTATE